MATYLVHMLYPTSLQWTTSLYSLLSPPTSYPGVFLKHPGQLAPGFSTGASDRHRPPLVVVAAARPWSCSASGASHFTRCPPLPTVFRDSTSPSMRTLGALGQHLSACVALLPSTGHVPTLRCLCVALHTSKPSQIHVHVSDTSQLKLTCIAAIEYTC